MSNLFQMPCCYFLISILWSLYQGIRGAIEQERWYQDHGNLKDWSNFEKWMILYIHDFVFRLVCTFSGFASLFLSYTLFKDFNSLEPASSALLIFLLLIGIVGVGGQLHHVILFGKMPKV